ncbi:MAG TPA: ATP-binding cassette domain-containing protein [Solirubrobacteraceae bacterium]|jgi:ABC-2 type transport system ATP-binding protein|nr:ATP-binding cassette domain-containing protein [Solirubrobacteraceae bacterium]
MNQMTSSPAIVAQGLGKRYGDQWALRDFELEVPAGTVLGLLGHNGAGKTTAIRILTTLALPTAGSASVAGFDVLTQPGEVRRRIGLASQTATVDGLMSAHANLEMIGRLYHLPRALARTRATELLERLRLADTGDQLVRDFSGGMRRRLDLAASLVAAPPVLFLDEPTTGLDPESRNELWELLRELVGEGATLLLTTQYLEEADRLGDDIVLLERGRITAKGTPAELKARYGGERIEVAVADAGQLQPAQAALESFADGACSSDARQLLLTVPVRTNTRLIEVVRALDEAGVDAKDVHRREATLDDVFLSITHSPRAQEALAS